MSDAKFVSPCAPPTPYEREVLEIIIEECAEIQQRATKALRFGLLEVQPGQPLPNTARMAREIGDLAEIVDVAVKAGIIDRREIDAGIVNKRQQLAKFMQRSKP